MAEALRYIASRHPDAEAYAQDADLSGVGRYYDEIVSVYLEDWERYRTAVRGYTRASLAAYQRVRDAYAEVAGPLGEIQREVSAVLRDPVDSLGAGERYWGATLQGIRDVRLNDPAVREARAEKQARPRAIRS